MKTHELAKLSPRLTHAFETDMRVKGRMQAHVVNAKGRVIKTMPYQDNLILDQGMDYYASNTWANLMNYCVAGTGTTPTRDVLDGTASQTGTTVTLSGSTYTFSGGDVGKWIGWDAGGYQAKITAYIDASNVTVATSQSVSAAAAKLYRCDQTGLTTEVKRTNTYPTYTYTDSRGASATFATSNVLTLRRTYDFSAEVGSVNYTEIGISPVATVASNLFARILLAGTVAVTSGQQLRITYELAITVSGTTRPSQTLTSSAGWPYTYNISSITGSGSAFTVTLSAAHHYVAGGSLTIAGAKRTRFTLTAAASTGSDFTLTTSASHGLSPGDSIEVEGVSPSGYNGTWTADTGTTGSTIVVTTTANPGTGTVFGNVRQTEPGTWYDGTWIIASVTSTTVVITSAITATAGADGTAKNNLGAVFYINHWPIAPLGGSGKAYGTPVSPELFTQWQGGDLPTFYFGSAITHSPGTGAGGQGCLDGTFLPVTQSISLHTKTSAITPPSSFPITGSVTLSGVTANACTTVTRGSYTNGNFYRDIAAEWNTGAANASTIRGLIFSQVNVASTVDFAFGWLFNEPQRKDSTNKLTITFRQSWSRVLS